MWFLRDPLRLSEQQLIVPQATAQLLLFLDGARSEVEIHEAFCQRIEQRVDHAVLSHILDQLDEACLLDNERAREAAAAQLRMYREQEFRPPALAGAGYPADPQALSALLREYGPDEERLTLPAWRGRGLISPHIDYMRGGTVYAQVWQSAAQAIAEAEMVLIFGTDHNGGRDLLTLTRQPYATPYGVLPAAPALVNELAAAYGCESSFAAELNHRDEHSIELSAIWLHFMFQELGRDPCPVTPLLCGSFAPYLDDNRHPADDRRLSAFINELQRQCAGKRVLAVASVDLAHVGPAFGDRTVMDERKRQQLALADHSLIEAIESGDHARFFREIAAVEDRNRICGFSSIYMMLRYLEQPGRLPVQGMEVAYEHCSADERDASLVSICGLLLT